MKFIIKVDTTVFNKDSLSITTHKIGKPQVFNDYLIIESYDVNFTKEYIESIPGVLSVMEDGVMLPNKIVPQKNNVGEWGVSYLGGTSDSNSGLGVNVYIIDNGVMINHEYFKGRGVQHAYAYDGILYSDHGLSPYHGTACAGVVASISPKCNILSMRSGFIISETLKCFDMIMKSHIDGSTNTVVSMSFSGENDVYSELIERMTDSGIIMVASAGNSGENDVTRYPGACPYVITVGAIDENKGIAYFSNGKKSGVDVWAPGLNIVTPSIESFTSYRLYHGTSCSCPFIAGIIANLLTGSSKFIDRTGFTWVMDRMNRNPIRIGMPNDTVVPRSIGYKSRYISEPDPIIVEPIEEDVPPTPPIVAPIPPKEDKKRDYAPFIVGVIALIVITAVIYFNF